jgi:hypothetical protein
VPSDVWPWLVGVVALLLVPEIALRRLGSVLARLLSAPRARQWFGS